jgi:hypothetical protein
LAPCSEGSVSAGLRLLSSRSDTKSYRLLFKSL